MNAAAQRETSLIATGSVFDRTAWGLNGTFAESLDVGAFCLHGLGHNETVKYVTRLDRFDLADMHLDEIVFVAPTA